MKTLMLVSLLLGTLPALALSGDYKAPGDGTVAEPEGPTWMRCTLGEEGEECEDGDAENVKWSKADQLCKEADLAGKTWRLPTKEELKTLVQSGQPSIYQDVFPNTAVYDYWTSTPDGERNHSVIDFSKGETSSRPDSSFAFVRCIAEAL